MRPRVTREVFTRNFGVWRESRERSPHGVRSRVPAGTRLPAAGEDPLTVTRCYRAVHNIGHFRYIEASQVDAEGATVRRHHRVG